MGSVGSQRPREASVASTPHGSVVMSFSFDGGHLEEAVAGATQAQGGRTRGIPIFTDSEEPVPDDRYHAIYFAMLLAGVGFLLPYNSFITDVDYLHHKYPGTSIVFDMSLTYILVALVAVLLNNALVERLSLHTRITAGYLLALGPLLFISICDVWLQLFSRDQAYAINLAAVGTVAFGCTAIQLLRVHRDAAQEVHAGGDDRREHGGSDGLSKPHPHQAAAARREGRHAHLLPGLRGPGAALLPAAPAGAGQPLRALPHSAAPPLPPEPQGRLPGAPRRGRRGRALSPAPSVARGAFSRAILPHVDHGSIPRWHACPGPESPLGAPGPSAGQRRVPEGQPRPRGDGRGRLHTLRRASAKDQAQLALLPSPAPAPLRGGPGHLGGHALHRRDLLHHAVPVSGSRVRDPPLHLGRVAAHPPDGRVQPLRLRGQDPGGAAHGLAGHPPAGLLLPPRGLHPPLHPVRLPQRHTCPPPPSLALRPLPPHGHQQWLLRQRAHDPGGGQSGPQAAGAGREHHDRVLHDGADAGLGRGLLHLQPHAERPPELPAPLSHQRLLPRRPLSPAQGGPPGPLPTPACSAWGRADSPRSFPPAPAPRPCPAAHSVGHSQPSPPCLRRADH
ncbi:equilibrative nucleoside transporter 4 isoform X1 [Cervus canadensis]|uniref:equilibrative nucleoside transporter 4 isoform X1 n=1 Tax=Cervus canadensis TaxID=1574408 RepID=UPI001CA310B4|nr:equilibrative nucleoside transporter 4 isoform X1 [Cervus canadensis]